MKQKKKFLDKEEFKKLLELAKKTDDRDYILFLIAGNLGLRVGEVVRLRKQDLDFNEKTINVPTLKQKSKGPLKRGKLPEIYVKLPGENIMNNKIFQSYINSVYLKQSEFLFPGKDKKHSYLSESGAQKTFKMYLKKLGIRASFHSLRHFRGDSIYKETLDLLSVSKILRHKSLKYARTYVHPGMKEMRRYLEMGGFVE